MLHAIIIYLWDTYSHFDARPSTFYIYILGLQYLKSADKDNLLNLNLQPSNLMKLNLPPPWTASAKRWSEGNICITGFLIWMKF